METKTEWYKKLAKKLERIKIGTLSLDDYIKEVDAKIENGNKALGLGAVSENKPMDKDYPLIPMRDIDNEARLIAVRWHENATNWIGDKHKLASDIMNYARRKFSSNAR